MTLNDILNKDPGRRTELIGRWPIDMGAAPKTQTQTNKMMTDRYRCGPKKTELDKEMIGRWSIDIGAGPTQAEHKLIGRWPIDIGATSKIQTDTENDRSI